MTNINRGAMFGLDARIALAIFGALSVISGAALYSAIQEARITAIFTTMQEAIKAYESLYIDTGSLVTATRFDCYDSHHLNTDNSISGWNGPYLSAPTSDDGDYVTIDYSGTLEDYSVYARNLKSSGWSTASTWASDIACTASTDDCSFWMQIVGADPTDTLGQELDERFDDGNGATGSIITGTMTGTLQVMIKAFPINSQ